MIASFYVRVDSEKDILKMQQNDTDSAFLVLKTLLY